MKQLYNIYGIKSPLSWYGGKSSIVDWLLDHFPRCQKYVEVFGGAGSPLFARMPSKLEVYNDFDPGLVNFFSVIKDPGKAEELCRQILLTPNSREEHDQCRRDYPAADPIEWARQFFVLIRQSYVSSFIGTWAYSIAASPGGFHSATKLIPPAGLRLANVRLENQSFTSLLESEDGPNTLFYLDPPYLTETRKATKVYQYEMSREQHEQLLDQLVALKGMAVLSGYPSSLYESKLADWYRVTKQVPCYSSATTPLSAAEIQERSVWR